MNSSRNQKESFNESIMNWSMKISNYSADLMGGAAKYRSQSRSPPPLSLLQQQHQQLSPDSPSSPAQSSHYHHFLGLDPATHGSNTNLQTSLNIVRPNRRHHTTVLGVGNNTNSRLTAAVTSWGQLKHSKSSSSQIGSPLETSRCDYGTQTTTTPVSPPLTRTPPPQTPPPLTSKSSQQQPLYKLFQTSRSSMCATPPAACTPEPIPASRASRRDATNNDDQIAPQHIRQHSNVLVRLLFLCC